MKISIFGLGYVGAVSLACLARDGHEVFGVDIDETKLGLIRSGKSPIIEDGILELMAEVVQSGRVSVTASAAEAIAETDLSFVCVGTPSLPNGDQNLEAMMRLAEQLGDALRDKNSIHTIVVRSTVQPGTTEGSILPVIEDRSGKKAGEGFHLCFQPEFLREGSSIKDYDDPPMTIVGSDGEYPSAQLKRIFGNLPCKFIDTDVRTAEMLKYACNAFHTLKINFANEIGRICQPLGADSHRVMALLCEDKQLNISPAYLRPGFAFGGSCLPKDLRALLHMAKRNDVEVPMLSGLLPSNRIHIEHALDLILRRQKRRVGVVGLSFKSGTDDLRESPLVTLVENMIGKGLDLKIYDPEVQVSRLIGANRVYIENAIPHIGNLMCNSVEDVVGDVDIVVVGLSGEGIMSELRAHTREEQYILDLVGIHDADEIAGDIQGICW